MTTMLQRSFDQPIREGLTWDERWKGPDNGLVWCWERGRLSRLSDPNLAKRAEQGELVPLDWKGGVTEKLKVVKKAGTLKYLATWQGLRGEDLNLDLEGEYTIVCSKTEQIVVFSKTLPQDDE